MSTRSASIVIEMACVACLLAAGLLAAACGGGAAPPPAPRELFVLCGAANRPPMEEIARAFEAERGVKVAMTFGGSGTLLAQCEMSRRGDIYLPGSPDYIEIARRKGLLVEGSDTIVVYLVPAIIVPRGNPAGVRRLEDLARPGVRVALADPKAVAVGLYAVEILDGAGLLEPVLRNVATFGENVEKTAAFAAGRAVDAIIGWSVLEAWNPSRLEAVPIAPERIPRISYVPISIPTTVSDTALARDFIDFVLSPVGRAAYERYGYIAGREEALRFAPEAGIGGEYVVPPSYAEILRRRGR